MLNNNPQTQSEGRNYFRNVCPQRNSLTAHDSTLQRASERESEKERDTAVMFLFISQGNFKLTCEKTTKNKNGNQTS